MSSMETLLPKEEAQWISGRGSVHSSAVSKPIDSLDRCYRTKSSGLPETRSRAYDRRAEGSPLERGAVTNTRLPAFVAPPVVFRQ
ncbi:hypothetical protein N7468_007007 [Penicillium chermesinum]|uniref:Uncharacterized protein n=1 Tax=Penicillium chermesinum TaxID=63820 RepID=A0A9W9TK50_9EURO|nr:uncharacterized protein N7468_007007 [Penicillium chermesinum]KAJ5225782.1 hypothetical protein N7468_007007 [Penicillium chermesinum]